MGYRGMFGAKTSLALHAAIGAEADSNPYLAAYLAAYDAASAYPLPSCIDSEGLFGVAYDAFASTLDGADANSKAVKAAARARYAAAEWEAGADCDRAAYAAAVTAEWASTMLAAAAGRAAADAAMAAADAACCAGAGARDAPFAEQIASAKAAALDALAHFVQERTNS